jgi:hypothetical protein
MQQYMRLIGREILVVNLDPANEFHHGDADTNITKTNTKTKDKDTQEQ